MLAPLTSHPTLMGQSEWPPVDRPCGKALSAASLNSIIAPPRQPLDAPPAAHGDGIARIPRINLSRNPATIPSTHPPACPARFTLPQYHPAPYASAHAYHLVSPIGEPRLHPLPAPPSSHPVLRYQTERRPVDRPCAKALSPAHNSPAWPAFRRALIPVRNPMQQFRHDPSTHPPACRFASPDLNAIPPHTPALLRTTSPALSASRGDTLARLPSSHPTLIAQAEL